MDVLEVQANALLDALIAAERRCLLYEPKDPRRDESYRRACHAYGDAANTLEDWLAEFLRPAIQAEDEATAEEALV